MERTGSDLFELVSEIEYRIGDLEHGDICSLYDLLYEAAARAVPIGFFYVCILSPESDELHFVYSRDGDLLLEPVRMPLGDGPTSWVVRNQRPLTLTSRTEAIHNRGRRFGDVSQVSRSAVHLPMRTVGLEGRSFLVGVMSAQSYEPDAIGAQEVLLLQGLADRAARILHLDSVHDGCRRRIAFLEEELRRQQARSDRINEHLVHRLADLTNEAQTLIGMTPDALRDLKAAERDLIRSCHHAQTLLALAITHLDEAHPDEAFDPEPPGAQQGGLTDREMEIAVLLASGRSNASIAESLYISVDTVKFHCANLYRKLGVNNRVQAARAAAALINTQPT